MSVERVETIWQCFYKKRWLVLSKNHPRLGENNRNTSHSYSITLLIYFIGHSYNERRIN